MRKGASRFQQIILGAGGNSKLAPPLAFEPSAHPERGARLSIFRRRADERVRILSQICRALDGHAAKGHALRPHFRALARRWRGAVYRADSSQPVRLSAGSIARIYYGRWLHGGKKVEGLNHRYGQNAPKFKLSRDHRHRVRKALQTACTLSEFRALVFNRCRKRPSMDSVRRCFSAEEWLAFSKAFMARRQARAAEARFAAWVKAEVRTFNDGGVR